MSDYDEQLAPDDERADPVGDEFELVEAEEEAGFDLGIDVARPLAQYGAESFDVDLDVGYGNGPQGS